MLKQPVGIKAYSAWLPPLEIDQNQIVRLAEGSVEAARSLGIERKRWAQPTDNTLTLSVECLKQLPTLEPIGALYLGTETPVYSVGNTAAAVADFVGLSGNNLKTADLEFACRAGTLALINAIGHVNSFDSDALAVAADVAKGAPGDVLAMTTGAGAAAFTISADLETSLAHITGAYSFTKATGDFWRATESNYPNHAGRFSNQSYTETITAAVEGFCQSYQAQLSDFDHVIFHQPNGKLPLALGKKLGVSPQQLELGMCFADTGNLYAAMTPFALAKVLAQAQPNQTILVASYGSGAGSDVLALKTTSLLTNFQQKHPLELTPTPYNAGTN